MAGQSDPNQSKNDYAILWIIGIIIVIGGVIWWLFSNHLKLAFAYVKKYEAIVGNFLPKLSQGNKLDQTVDYLNGTVINASNKLDSAALLDVSVMAQISEVVGQAWLITAAGLVIVMAFFLWKGHASTRWNTKHNMDTLVKQEQKNWPQISPVVPIDLVDADLNKGPWAMAQNPMQFAKANKLVEVKQVADKKAVWKADLSYEATLIKDKALRVFAGQMGPMWMGVNKLPPHTKALFSIFAARCEHKADEARQYLAELAQDAAKGEMQYSRTDEFLKNYGQNKAVQRCIKRHAYVYTIMASMLELARTDGVFASADFLWLKPVDRKLWYMLNTVGRQTAPAEIAGPWAHWLAEKEMHRPLSVPMVECAVTALEHALAQMIYKPDEDQDEFPTETPEEV